MIKQLTAAKFISFGAVAIGLFAAASLFAAHADTTPLAVACSGTPTDNTITWTASPSGGNTPYSFLWAGDQVAGNTSDTVIGTYTASGTYTADIQVMDASSSVATSTCDATVTIESSSTSTTPTSTPMADVGIMQTLDNANPATGTIVNYLLTVSALGPDTSTGVVVTDMLPTGLTFDNATASTGAYNDSTGIWSVGNITPSSTATLAIAATVNAGTEGETLTNTATVSESSSSSDPNSDNDSAITMLGVQAAPTSTTPTSTPTSTISEADLSIMQMVDNANPATGTTVNYTITVSALGPDTSTAAVATDLLPTGLTFENAIASAGTYSSSTGQWTIGDLMANSTATLMIEAMVNPGTEDTSITNSATVGEASSVTNMGTDTSAAATVTVQPASTPLAVNCDFSFNGANTVMWTSTVSGGTTPYTYLWSGTQVNGATSSDVTATYPAPGAYFAAVNVTDAAGDIGSAACSASVGISGGGGGSTSTTPTVPVTLTIGQRGAFTGRGMMVTNIGTGSFQAEIWGITYTINWTRKNPAITVGGFVNVIGTITTANPLVVDANTVRNNKNQ